MNCCSTDRPAIICLTPVKDEAWILDRFLKAASLWADRIIIADQQSTDGSRSIARQYNKVILLDNPSKDYNEGMRQRLLIDQARKIDGPKLLVALDADEFLSGNYSDGSEWRSVANSKPGTVISFERPNIMPGFRSYWRSERRCPFAYVDDGCNFHGSEIHSERIPVSPGAPRLVLHEVKVMHFQFTDWDRMLSKHRWYVCWERLHRKRTPLLTYRTYHHMDGVRGRELMSVPENWFTRYEAEGIDLRQTSRCDGYRWDDEVLKLIHQYGAEHFVKEAIWDFDWFSLALSRNLDWADRCRDPRGPATMLLHRYLKVSQPFASSTVVRALDKCLSHIWK